MGMRKKIRPGLEPGLILSVAEACGNDILDSGNQEFTALALGVV
jgi:hypothetical protein